MRHATGQFSKRFHRAQGHGQSEYVQIVEHIRRIDPRHDFEAQHGATALEPIRGNLILMPRQSRIRSPGWKIDSTA